MKTVKRKSFEVPSQLKYNEKMNKFFSVPPAEIVPLLHVFALLYAHDSIFYAVPLHMKKV